MTRTTRKVLIGVAVLAGLAMAFLLEERWRGQWQLAAWKREMIAKGERFTIAEIAPPVTNPAVRVLAPTQLQSLLVVEKGVFPIYHPGKKPVGAEFVLWAADSWFSANDQATAWADVARSFEDTRQRLAASRQELTNTVFQTKPRYEDGFTLLLPHLATLKGAVQTLASGTLLALHERLLDEALDNLIAQQSLVELQANEPTFISQLVRIAVSAIAETSVRQALWADGWTDAQLAALQAAWQKSRFLSATSRALEMERAMAAEYYTGSRGTDSELRATFDGFGGMLGDAEEIPEWLRPLANAGNAFRAFAFVKIWRFAWSSQDQLFHHRMLQKPIETARAAARSGDGHALLNSDQGDEELPRGSAGAAEFEKMSAYDRARHWLSLMSLPALDKGIQKALLAECTREMTVTAIALKRYRLKHGRYPEKLADLVPGLLATVPRDWMDGQPLRYRLNADGSFTLWSVGNDGKDDGGDPVPPKGELRGMNAGRDIVWPRAATAEETAEAMKKSTSMTPRGANLQQLIQGASAASTNSSR